MYKTQVINASEAYKRSTDISDIVEMILEKISNKIEVCCQHKVFTTNIRYLDYLDNSVGSFKHSQIMGEVERVLEESGYKIGRVANHTDYSKTISWKECKDV